MRHPVINDGDFDMPIALIEGFPARFATGSPSERYIHVG